MKFIRLLLLITMFNFALFGKSDSVQLNINDMEIAEFIKMVAKIDNKNILVPLHVRGKITYISKKPIPKKNIFHLLQMILKDKGFTIIDSHKGYYIVSRISDAHKKAPKIANYSREEMVHTAILPIHNVDVTKLSSIVKNYLSRSGRLLISQETNSLIVTDLPENIQTAKQLIKRLDKRPNRKIEFVEFKNIRVGDAFSQIKGIADSLFDPKIDSEKILLFKNDKTNILTIVAEQPQIDKLLEFIKKIDVPDKVTKQQVYFIKLNNANAEDVVKVVSQVISKKRYEKNEPRASITFDKELNSLVLISSEEEYPQYLELIKKLDIERQQVYVKARIIEISKNKAKNLGLKYGIAGFDVTEAGLYSLSSTLNGGTYLPPAGIPASIPDNISSGFGLGVTLSFLDSNGVSNTLSEPSILCLNNQESSIYVGQTESILTTSSTGASTTAITQNSYTREDIGLTLKIKPRISNDNKVILNVDATLEDVVPGSIKGMPTTTKREVKTTAVVQDGEAVIVGGLIKDKISKNSDKIPLLGDIPLIGALFRDDSYKIDKINLIIILTPYIIKKSEDLETLRQNLQYLAQLEHKVVRQIIKQGLETNSSLQPSLKGETYINIEDDEGDLDD